MNKTKITLISIGGAAAAVALVLGWFAFSGWQETSEKAVDLEDARSNGERLAGQKVRPCAESVKAIKAKEAGYAEWTDKARALAASGDVAYEQTTPPAFKAFMVEGAKRLADLPGAVEGKLVARDFAFGFNEFITGGLLPTAADLPRLQREWHDVVMVVDVLAASGVSSVNEITLVREAPKPVEAPAKGRGRKGKQAAEAKPDYAATVMTVEFRTDPEGLVAALNAFTTNRSFIVAENLSFVRTADEIGEKIGGAKKPDEAKGGRRPGRKRLSAADQLAAKAAEQQAQAEFKGGVITDPQETADLKVSLKVSVYDFLTAAKPAAGEKPAETAEEE